MSPEGVSIQTARVFNPEVKTEEEKEAAILEMNSEIVKAARELGSVEPAVTVYACTTGSFIKRPGYDQEIGEKIKGETGVPGVSTTTAVAEALKAFGIKRVALATPYNQKIGEREKAFFENAIPDFKDVVEKHLGIVPNIPKGRLTPYSAYKTARDIDTQEADGIFISCTNWRTIEIIEEIEADTGKPVVTSNQASM